MILNAKTRFRGFLCEAEECTTLQSRIGAQKKTRTSTTLRSPAPEAGVSTNFTIWAVSSTLLPLLMARILRTNL